MPSWHFENGKRDFSDRSHGDGCREASSQQHTGGVQAAVDGGSQIQLP
jgi:hypothetical protein